MRNTWVTASAVVATLLLAACGSSSSSSTGGTNSADRLATAELRDADAAAKACFTDSDSYADCDGTKLSDIEPALNYVDASSPGINAVSVAVVDGGDTWAGATWSTSGTCFTVQDNVDAGTAFGRFASAGQSCTAGGV